MPHFIFNSKRQFWNPSTRNFQNESISIRSMTEAKMEIRMASKKDITSDIMSFEDNHEKQALEYISNVVFDEDRLTALRDMNNRLR